MNLLYSPRSYDQSIWLLTEPHGERGVKISEQNLCLVNSIQAGEGGGGGGGVYRFLPGCAETVCSRLMKLSDF